MTRWALRAAAVAVGVVAALPVAGVASAHVEVEASNARAGATNVTLTFDAEAESSESGIKYVRVILPEGIAPADVSLVSAPSGWTLATTVDGYQIGGLSLPVGRNVVHKVKVKQLPDARSLTFRSLVTYANGDVDRWIGDPDSANPAPVLNLQAAAPATSAAPTTAAPTSAAPEPFDSLSIAPTTPTIVTTDSNNWWWWVVGLAVLLGAGLAGLLASRRRRAGS
ncbi:hypothetical protein GCM10009682_12210 [Luedemannella flava]|uniref:DUF1775 domain-containing protein n=1 Tax=Luedemannella flava TaxID=349316 RepID=A0ABN2LKZ0_9ACTN